MKKALAEIKKHLLTAISYMLPLVVASGLLIAVGNLMGGEVVTDLSTPGQVEKVLPGGKGGN